MFVIIHLGAIEEQHMKMDIQVKCASKTLDGWRVETAIGTAHTGASAVVAKLVYH